MNTVKKIFIITFLFLFSYLGWKIYSIPSVDILLKQYPHVTFNSATQKATITLSNKRPPYWTTTRDVSKVAIGAIIVSEDWSFYQHDGFDSKQIRDALEDAWAKGKLGRGASTITQQVIKNVFLTSERSLLRKLIEFYLSIKIEKALPKNKILEIYLNIVELGPGLFGIQKASYYYFSKPPSMLNAKEGAFLAMLLPSPKRYSQSFRKKELTSFARKTINSILFKMKQAQYITEDEWADSHRVSLSFETIHEEKSAEELAANSSDETPNPNEQSTTESTVEAETEVETEGETPEQSAFD